MIISSIFYKIRNCIILIFLIFPNNLSPPSLKSFFSPYLPCGWLEGKRLTILNLLFTLVDRWRKKNNEGKKLIDEGGKKGKGINCGKNKEIWK